MCVGYDLQQLYVRALHAGSTSAWSWILARRIPMCRLTMEGPLFNAAQW